MGAVLKDIFPYPFYCWLFIVLIQCNSWGAVAYHGRDKNFRVLVPAGISMVTLDGGAKVTSAQIKQLTYGLGFFWQWRYLSAGLQYQTGPAVRVSKFKFADNSIGVYDLSFQRRQLFIGGHYDLWRLHFIIGNENIQWVGAPDLNKKAADYYHTGLQASYDCWKNQVITVPIIFSALNHADRKNEFENYPNDTITFAATTEYNLSAAISFEF